MITRETAVSQIKRLSRLRGVPDPDVDTDKIALEELVTALMKTAENDLHAFDIVSEILEKSQFFPVPADIYGQRRDKPWTPKLTYRCEACWDTGWRTVEDGGQGTALRCSCRPATAPQAQRKSGGLTRADSIGRQA